ncbi:hypothetical protein LDG_8302 [Legionella drancourtii LLAP12]|uniref:Uncharacterized protein n=1 Tax=Legionella drancourtii LLAP12 TaxID=658187 RepID=G9ESN1_9GAMM|nr:hypothetical protein LDG_8302 [Legionella drancourtii LLAP12]
MVKFYEDLLTILVYDRMNIHLTELLEYEQYCSRQRFIP